MQHIAKPEAFAALLADLDAHLAAEGVAEIRLPYDCIAYSARRRD